MTLTILKELVLGYAGIIKSMLMVLIPVMIILELLITYHIMEKIASRLTFVTKLLRLNEQSVFPLLVGIMAGITFGAGAMIEINKKSPIPERDLWTIGVLIFICHGMIETTLIFAVAGANIWAVSLGRLLIAFAAAMLAARLPLPQKK